ncbi:Phosphate transporter family protein [Flavobacterium indicum GPTSA100-9 = DSM 17447]|uniref:Phosphate transporter n=2 Tax=Flavobacterium TaxID=237 RepID=H8XTR2_FLAIG|nr:Phosphate transporter family protein [Flavobacterium indicum GPTSA100-9 = DSM 17447]
MNMTNLILILAVVFLSFNNGANDIFKGVATLYSSKTISYKSALVWAVLTTISGSICSIFLVKSLLKNFSGKGLVPDELLLNPIFAISVVIGAALTIFFATKIGMPVSTTHALVGSLFGVGILSVGLGFNFQKLADAFVVPLLASPLLASIFAVFFYYSFSSIRKKLGITKQSCICLIEDYNAKVTHNDFVSEIKIENELIVSSCDSTSEIYSKSIFGISSQKIVDFFHFISAGAVGFARGLNDTPKIAGILLLITSVNSSYFLYVVAIAMAVGGILNARKVANTMSNKITTMNTGQGFTANLVTSILVTTASFNNLPVSTTHVSVGSIFGIGLVNKSADFKMILRIVLSWILTLPIAAIISAIIFFVLK